MRPAKEIVSPPVASQVNSPSPVGVQRIKSGSTTPSHQGQSQSTSQVAEPIFKRPPARPGFGALRPAKEIAPPPVASQVNSPSPVDVQGGIKSGSLTPPHQGQSQSTSQVAGSFFRPPPSPLPPEGYEALEPSTLPKKLSSGEINQLLEDGVFGKRFFARKEEDLNRTVLAPKDYEAYSTLIQGVKKERFLEYAQKAPDLLIKNPELFMELANSGFKPSKETVVRLLHVIEPGAQLDAAWLARIDTMTAKGHGAALLNHSCSNPKIWRGFRAGAYDQDS